MCRLWDSYDELITWTRLLKVGVEICTAVSTNWYTVHANIYYVIGHNDGTKTKSYNSKPRKP